TGRRWAEHNPRAGCPLTRIRAETRIAQGGRGAGGTPHWEKEQRPRSSADSRTDRFRAGRESVIFDRMITDGQSVLAVGAGIFDRPQRAIHLVFLAPFDLDLDGRVPDAEVVPELPGHGLQDLLAAPDALLRNEDVTATGNK